jgi:hypothetical protein
VLSPCEASERRFSIWHQPKVSDPCCEQTLLPDADTRRRIILGIVLGVVGGLIAGAVLGVVFAAIVLVIRLA